MRRAVTSSFPPTPPTTSSTLSQTQRFLLDDTTTDNDDVGGGNERVTLALAHGSSRTSTPIAKQIIFSDTITKIFPKTHKLDTISKESFLENDNEIGDVEDESSADISSVIDGLKEGNLPIDLEFFCSGEKNKEKLTENATENISVLNDSNKKFISYLTSKYGDFVLTKNKIKIHLKSGQIFHDNNLTSESFYDFLNNQ